MLDIDTGVRSKTCQRCRFGKTSPAIAGLKPHLNKSDEKDWVLADNIALHYQSRDVIFEKSKTLIAVRARAGMAAAMYADIHGMADVSISTPPRTIGAFDVVELRGSTDRIDQELDRLRGRASVAAASHVYGIKGETGLMVPDGHLHLRFDASVPGHVQQAVLTRYRLQIIEERGQGDYLVRITSGSRNPLATAAALQAESNVSLAEPEFIGVD